MRYFYRYLVIAVLILLITGSAWMTVLTERSLHRTDHEKNTIDAYFKDSEYKQFNNLGQLILVMKAPYTTLHKKDNQLDAVNPMIKAYNNDKTYWLIQANHLSTQTKTHVSHLTGNVVIVKDATEKDPSVTVKTEELTLYPHDRAVTDAPVTLWQGDGFQVHGTGCIIDLKTNTVQILSNADALLVPHSPTAEYKTHENTHLSD
jgi:LPS export ABC transporter protein LptC